MYICQDCLEVEQQDIEEELWIDNELGNESSPDYADKTPTPDDNYVLCADTVGCSVICTWSVCICENNSYHRKNRGRGGRGCGRARGGYYNSRYNNNNNGGYNNGGRGRGGRQYNNNNNRNYGNDRDK